MAAFCGEIAPPGQIVYLPIYLEESEENIKVGKNTLINGKASLLAEAGPIIIGENNIIEQQVTIINKSKDKTSLGNPVPLTIGANNVFDVGCEIRAKSIGDYNVFEPNCYVGQDVVIGNGCIIGAGCHVIVAEKLPDHTVITRSDFVRSVALDRSPDPDDLVRQCDELTAMSEIVTKEEFSSNKTDVGAYAILEVHTQLPNGFLLLLSKDSTAICYLPPIRLIASLPQDYPSQSPPDFVLSCSWLCKSKLDELVTELQRIWEENRGEVLFLWWSFLKDQSLKSLEILNWYNLYEKYSLEMVRNPQPFFDGSTNFVDFLAKEKVRSEVDSKILSYRHESLSVLYFFLKEYDFKKNLQTCIVCFSTIPGELCKLLTCGHGTCKECLKEMCEVHIKQGTVQSILCPQETCGLEIPANSIKELVSQELYDRYDKLMTDRAVDKMCNLYCPLRHCQYPIILESDDPLVVCPNCEHAFCQYCKRTYHGIEDCKLRNEDKQKLIETYQNGSTEKKLELEKRYGRKLLNNLVGAAQTEIWISENSKECPCCKVNIEKNNGCNKMVCQKCNATFCWLCLTRLNSLNPYSHYQDSTVGCFNLLFDGLIQEAIEDEFNFEEADFFIEDGDFDFD